MAKYNKKLTEEICKLIRSDSYTIAEICRLTGISEETFYVWKKEKSEFSESIKKAEEDRRQFFAVEAKKSLLKKIQGYMVKEKKIVTSYPVCKEEEGAKRKRVVKEQSVTEKYFQPDTAAIIFTLCNTDPDNWKNRQNTDITTGGEKLQFGTKELTNEEAVACLKRLKEDV